MSVNEFNPKHWCMEMSKGHVRRKEYDIASTFRSVVEHIDSLNEANAELKARYDALREAVKKYLDCSDKYGGFEGVDGEVRRNGVDLGYIVIPDKGDPARDTIDKICGGEK